MLKTSILNSTITSNNNFEVIFMSKENKRPEALRIKKKNMEKYAESKSRIAPQKEFENNVQNQ